MSEVTITAQPDGTFADSTGKKFLPQEKVDGVVQERLARDREARKSDAEAEATKLREQVEKAQSELTAASDKIKTLEGTSATAAEISAKVETSWQEIEKAIPEEKRKLVPGKYSAAEKIEYVAQNKGVFFPDASVTKPETPLPASVNTTSGDPKYGGYSSLVEWAQREPLGYLKAQREGKLPK